MAINKIDPQINDAVGDTLFIPLYMRCKENNRPDAIIQDPLACKIINKLHYDFSKYDKGIMSSTGVALRVRHFDDQVKAFILKSANPVIVIMGCGLDTRFQRLGDATKKAVFYELDIPEVIGLRKQFIPQTANNLCIAASMFEEHWMDTLNNQHPKANFMFVIEGVLMYFEQEIVKKLFWDLANRFKGAEIHFDVINKWMSRHSHLHDTVKFTKATFKFGTDDDYEFETWATDLKFKSRYLFTDFKEWKRAGILGWIMKLMPRFKNSGRMLSYQVLE